MWHLSFRVKISVCCFYLLEVSLQGSQTHHNLWYCDILGNVLPGKLTLVKKKKLGKKIFYMYLTCEKSHKDIVWADNYNVTNTMTFVKKLQQSSGSGDKIPVVFVWCNQHKGVVNFSDQPKWAISAVTTQWSLVPSWPFVLTCALPQPQRLNPGEALLCR